MKNENGITLFVLVITIIIIIILSGIAIKSGTTLLQASNASQYVTIMKLVKTRSQSVMEEISFSKNEKWDNLLISDGMPAFSNSNQELYLEMNKKYADPPSPQESPYQFSIWTKDILKENGIDNSILDKDTVFFVVFNKNTMKTEDVFLEKGIVVDGIKYFSLNDLEKVVVNDSIEDE